MDFFQQIQKLKDDEYILVSKYLTRLSNDYGSSIVSVVNRLLSIEIENTPLYVKLDDGNYRHMPYINFNSPHPVHEVLNDAKAESYEDVLSDNFIQSINHLYFKETELPSLKKLLGETTFNKYNPKKTTENTDLKTENVQLKAKIEELEKQLAQAQQVTTEDEELQGLQKRNEEKRQAKNTVMAFADYLWKMDKGENIRTGDMLQQVKMFMLAVGNHKLPDKDDNLKEWFADVRPDYAKKAGKKPKNAPTEIPLIMKL